MKKYEVRDAGGGLVLTIGPFHDEDQKHFQHEVNLLRLTNPEYTYTIVPA